MVKVHVPKYFEFDAIYTLVSCLLGISYPFATMLVGGGVASSREQKL